jgi:protein TonB
MFAQHIAPPAETRLLGPTVFSVVFHVGIVAAFLFIVHPEKKPEVTEKELTVHLMKTVPTQAPPPPPPPPPAARQVRKPTPRKPEVLRQPQQVQPIPVEKLPETPPEPEPTPEPEEPAGVEGGMAGGVEGGVIGGVVGGVLGGQLGGTGEPPPKPKNVPLFVIQRDVVRQEPPRLSEVFKQRHRGTGTLTGQYRICVAVDGHVYDVVVVTSVPGADEDIISGIKEGWQYKPQKVPVCFLYNIPITIQ